MFFFQYPGPNQKIPITTKISMAIWIILALGLLSFFAFSFFIIALLVGVVLFTANLFQKKRTPIPHSQQGFRSRPYSPNKKDDDIIDI
ncbi:MAG: hypothetical protein H8E32_16610 [Nitrospinae bacterium]|nr:hypothetical protein [Nitrospinota bacterium]